MEDDEKKIEMRQDSVNYEWATHAMKGVL